MFARPENEHKGYKTEAFISWVSYYSDNFLPFKDTCISDKGLQHLLRPDGSST